MEARATDPGSPGGAYYSMAGAYLQVYDGVHWGTVELMFATSTYRSNYYANDPFHAFIAIPPNVWSHFDYTAADIAALLPGITASAIQSVSGGFESYCSWWNGGANGDVWFDNFTISGIPADLKVSPTQPTAGAYASFTASGMTPGARAFLAFSRTGLGSTPVPPLRLTLDIAQAAQAASPTLVAVNGTAVWTILLPVSTAGQSVWLQAAESGRSTRVLPITIL
jgi:hypothetical protein